MILNQFNTNNIIFSKSNTQAHFLRSFPVKKTYTSPISQRTFLSNTYTNLLFKEFFLFLPKSLSLSPTFSLSDPLIFLSFLFNVVFFSSSPLIPLQKVEQH